MTMQKLLRTLKRADEKIEDIMSQGVSAARAEAIVFDGTELTLEQADLLYAHANRYRDTVDGYVIDEDVSEAETLGVDVVYLRDKSGSIENMALLMTMGYKRITPTTLLLYTTSKRFYEVIAMRMEKE